MCKWYLILTWSGFGAKVASSDSDLSLSLPSPPFFSLLRIPLSPASVDPAAASPTVELSLFEGSLLELDLRMGTGRTDGRLANPDPAEGAVVDSIDSVLEWVRAEVRHLLHLLQRLFFGNQF